MTRTSLYWWSPSRSPRDLKPELQSASQAWFRQFFSTRRLLKNFGDEFSPLAWELATGRRATWAPADRADVFAIGSILQKAMEPDSDAAIWGTGARGPLSTSHGSSRRQRVLAVRGPKTAQELGLGDIPVGDPGLLVREAFPRLPQRQLSLRVFLPHYRSLQTRKGREQVACARSMGFTVVHAGANPMEIATTIAQAQSVLTSSLHGLVFAHSLGTACESIAPPSTEPDFKYHDYYASLGFDYSPVPDARDMFAKHLSPRHAETMEAERDTVQHTLPPLLEGLTRAANSYYG